MLSSARPVCTAICSCAGGKGGRLPGSGWSLPMPRAGHLLALVLVPVFPLSPVSL